MTTRSLAAPVATEALARPIVLVALATLVLNDHVLKATMPGMLTGKLSDFAGMIFFPLLLASGFEHVGIRHGRRTIIVATIATGAVFASIKLSCFAAHAYRVAVAALQWPVHAILSWLAGNETPPLGDVHLVMDRTDLIALIALAVPLAVARPKS